MARPCARNPAFSRSVNCGDVFGKQVHLSGQRRMQWLKRLRAGKASCFPSYPCCPTFPPMKILHRRQRPDPAHFATDERVLARPMPCAAARFAASWSRGQRDRIARAPALEASPELKIKPTGVRITVPLGARPPHRRGPRGPFATGAANVSLSSSRRSSARHRGAS